MQSNKNPFPSIKTFVSFLIGLILLASESAHAGCSEIQGAGWVADASSGTMIENLGTGTIVECGNISGAFGGFQKGSFYAGHATCTRDCDQGFKPGVTYIKVGEKWAPGKLISGENAVCVQQKGANRKYCWSQ